MSAIEEYEAHARNMRFGAGHFSTVSRERADAMRDELIAENARLRSAFSVTACAAMERDRDHFLALLRAAMCRECDWKMTQEEFEQWCADLGTFAPDEQASPVSNTTTLPVDTGYHDGGDTNA